MHVAAGCDSSAGTSSAARDREMLRDRIAFAVMECGRLQLRDRRERQNGRADVLREPDLLRRLALFSGTRQGRRATPHDVEAELRDVEHRAQGSMGDRDMNAAQGLAPRPIAVDAAPPPR